MRPPPRARAAPAKRSKPAAAAAKPAARAAKPGPPAAFAAPAASTAKSAVPAAAARPYRGRAPEQRRLDRRARLLASALDLVGSQGYARTNLTALCAHAGVSTRDFYTEFASRDALLAALYEHLVANVLGQLVRGLGEAPEGPRARVVHGLRAFLHAYLDDPRVARILCIEIGGVSPELEQLRRRGMRSFVGLVENQAYELLGGMVPRSSLHLSALALVGATNELIVEYLVATPPPPLTALEDNMALIFLALIEASPRATALLEQLATDRI